MDRSEFENLADEVWQHLLVARGAWRTPVLATARAGGGADARTVVLHDVSVSEREVVFFTDRRSGKVSQLEADPKVCLALYDDERRLQARLYGEARRVQEAGVLDSWWKVLSAKQHRLYALDVLADKLVVDEEKGRDNFTAFRVTIDRFHCLWINHDSPNEAVEFTWRDAHWEARVVRP